MKLPIAYYNDPILRQKALRVEYIDDQLRQLVTDMIETMHTNNGIGLAAPQIHQLKTLFITCVPIQKPNGRWMSGQDRVFINPQILSLSEETQTFTEGCLSIPKISMNVTRPSTITIQATDLNGNSFQETLSGFEATNFMHEYDHLNGVLIIDYLSIEERKALGQLFNSSIEQS
jgi:peptide deformylase